MRPIYITIDDLGWTLSDGAQGASGDLIKGTPLARVMQALTDIVIDLEGTRALEYEEPTTTVDERWERLARKLPNYYKGNE